MLSLEGVHSGIGQPFLALACAQWDMQLFTFVKWPQWDAQPESVHSGIGQPFLALVCAQWDRQLF